MQYNQENLEKVFRQISRHFYDKKISYTELNQALLEGYKQRSITTHPRSKSTFYNRFKNPVNLYPLFSKADFEIFCELLKFKGLINKPDSKQKDTNTSKPVESTNIFIVVQCKKDHFDIKSITEYLDKLGN